MAEIDDGGPAFPLSIAVGPAGDLYDASQAGPGMSLRDYFAGQVDVSAYVPRDTFEQSHGRRPTVDELAAYIADLRYWEADAMIAAGKATGEGE